MAGLAEGLKLLGWSWGLEAVGGGMMSCVFLVFLRSDCLQPCAVGPWKGRGWSYRSAWDNCEGCPSSRWLSSFYLEDRTAGKRRATSPCWRFTECPTPLHPGAVSSFSAVETVAQGALVRMAVSVPMLRSRSYPLSQGALSHHLNFLQPQCILSSARPSFPVDSCPFPLLSPLLWVPVLPMSWKSLGVTSKIQFPNLYNGKHKLSLWDSNTGLLTSHSKSCSMAQNVISAVFF